MLPLTQGSAIKWVNCILYWWLYALVDINPCHVQITPILSFWWLHKVDYNASPYGSALPHNREWACELSIFWEKSLWFSAPSTKDTCGVLIIALNTHECVIWDGEPWENHGPCRIILTISMTSGTIKPSLQYGLRLLCYTPTAFNCNVSVTSWTWVQ